MNKEVEHNVFSRFDNLINLLLKITVPVLLIILGSIFLYKTHENMMLQKQERLEKVLLKSVKMNLAGKDSAEIEEIKKELKK